MIRKDKRSEIRANKKSEIRTIITLSLTLFIAILLFSLAKAPLWQTQTQANFNEGTYANVSSNSTGVVKFIRELPNNQSDESANGGANMTGNVLLMHLNNDSSVGDNTTWTYDYSGLGNNGTFKGAGEPAWTTSGKFGSALQFDGVNDYVDCGNGASLNITTQVTIELWANLTGGGWMGLVSKGESTSIKDQNYVLFLGSTTPHLGFGDGTNYREFTGTAIATGWHHIVAVINSSTDMRIYVDSIQQSGTYGGTATTLTANTKKCLIGADSTAAEFFNNIIDEVAIYNRSLSAAEISAHYNRSVATHGTYESKVFDVNATASWKNLSWTNVTNWTNAVTNITFQVHSCDDAACSGEYLMGYDNTSNTYFNNSALANLSATNISINRYFQYKAYFETNDTSNTTSVPELWNVSVGYEDAVAPNITNMTISPSAPADVDPNVNISVTVNVTDVSPGVDTVLLRYANYSDYNNGVWSNKSMNSTGGNLYNASFNASVNGTWYYQVWANDTVGNAINNTPNSTNVQYDCSWEMSYDIQNASGVLESTSVIGNITINNTGDVKHYNNNCTIRFKISHDLAREDGLEFDGADKAPTLYFYLGAEGVLYSQGRVVNVTALFASTEKENENFVITVEDGYNRSDTAQRTISGYLNSVPGGPYLKPHIDALASINQSSSANLTAYVKNNGNETATNVTFNWTLPTGFTNSSGALNNNLTSLPNKTAAPDNIQYYNLTITTNETATYGTTYIYVNASCAQNVSGCSNRSYNISINVKCSHSDGKCGNGCVYDSTKDNHDPDCYVAPTIVTVPVSGGGGGAPGAAAIVSEATYELVRGKDKTFSLEIKNPFKDASLKEIKMKVAGYLAQYISIEPPTLDEIAPNSSFNFTIRITAPAYFTVGKHNLTFTIDSVKEVEAMKTARVEKRYVTLEIHELGREDATQLIALSKDYIEKMRTLELNIKEVRSLLEQSQEALEKSNYEKVQEFSEKIKSIATIALESYDKIVELDKKVKDAESRGARVESTRRMLGLAKAASERGDYMLALERAKDAEMTYALETKGEFNLFYFIAQNTLQFFFGMIITLALLTILFFRVKLSVMNHSLGGLREEEGILLGLMKTTQHECFVEKKLSMREYFQSMTQYEDKLSKAIQRSIALESAKASLFKFKSAKLELERKRLLDLMKETQRQYIKEGKLDTRVYTNRMHSYSTRLSEVEEELATREAERALRIDKLRRFLQFVAFLKVFKISRGERAKRLAERRKKKAMIEELEKEKEKLQREELLEKLKLKGAEELKRKAEIEKAKREKLERRFLTIAAREEEMQKRLAIERKLERPKEIKRGKEEKLRRERELEAKGREEAEKREKALERLKIISAEEEKRREELARKREIEELRKIRREEREKLQREKELEMLTRREEEEKLRRERELEAKGREEAEKRRKMLERFRREEEREEREKLRKIGLEKIKEYIQQTEKVGFSDEQIKAKLVERGWPPKLIKRAFKELGKKAKKEG